MADPNSKDNQACTRLVTVENALRAQNITMASIGTAVTRLTFQTSQLIAIQSAPIISSLPPPPPSNLVNLHLPLPALYPGITGESPLFRLQITQSIWGNLIQEPEQQIDYATEALEGDAAI